VLLYLYNWNFLVNDVRRKPWVAKQTNEHLPNPMPFFPETLLKEPIRPASKPCCQDVRLGFEVEGVLRFGERCPEPGSCKLGALIPKQAFFV
jgi:hypothetical protein